MNQKEDIKVLRKYLKQYRDCYARLKDIERRLMNTRSDEEQRKLRELNKALPKILREKIKAYPFKKKIL